MQDVCALAARVATSDAKVLIGGESGVGKGLLARYIHTHSARAGRPFIAANCAAFHEELLQSELFGHVKGSFTGADRNTQGTLAHAHLGTLFLDEVSDMSLRMQATLLRFLDSGEIQALGAHRTGARVNVRVISATNRDLTERVGRGQFREDLLHRLRVMQIVVPPLRNRLEDIPPLIQCAIARSGRPIRFTHEALAAMGGYRWPGNVRELQNVVERLAWMAPSDVIDRSDLPSFLLDGNASTLSPTFTPASAAERPHVTTVADWVGAA
jgi:DNA-binding NtrC family response regulator